MDWSGKDGDKAIKDFDQVLRLNPNSVFAYRNRSKAWQFKGEYNKAIKDLDAAIRLSPQNAVVIV
jgi:tetratricopeptide (TPR) repeat protein